MYIRRGSQILGLHYRVYIIKCNRLSVFGPVASFPEMSPDNHARNMKRCEVDIR